MQIITDRLILRTWRDEDRQAFTEINTDPDVMRYFPALQPASVSNASVDKRIAHQEKHGVCFWAAELIESHEFVGFIGMEYVHEDIPYAGSLEIGWRLAKEYWGRGLAPEGARACLAYAFSALKAKHVVSFTTENNLSSRRVMEKIGMVHEPQHDFDHPEVPDDSSLKRHVLYRIKPDSLFLA
ncbi:GNAT family N-acetyltransferase [Kordiimonas aquimaris]|uniref:GNAT family N-acetyltransferase n=1 Tax=Kordiimonas aquimaris TaxID=707591 RepID=UPI0021D04628|nr:GNAT family N-acetyltransferase [Kordiimonas aquimaris]